MFPLTPPYFFQGCVFPSPLLRKHSTTHLYHYHHSATHPTATERQRRLPVCFCLHTSSLTITSRFSYVPSANTLLPDSDPRYSPAAIMANSEWDNAAFCQFAEELETIVPPYLAGPAISRSHTSRNTLFFINLFPGLAD